MKKNVYRGNARNELANQFSAYVRFGKELEYLVRQKVVDNVKPLGLMIFSCHKIRNPLCKQQTPRTSVI